MKNQIAKTQLVLLQHRNENKLNENIHSETSILGIHKKNKYSYGSHSSAVIFDFTYEKVGEMLDVNSNMSKTWLPAKSSVVIKRLR